MKTIALLALSLSSVSAALGDDGTRQTPGPAGAKNPELGAELSQRRKTDRDARGAVVQWQIQQDWQAK